MKYFMMVISLFAFLSVFAEDGTPKENSTNQCLDSNKAIIDFSPKKLELYGHEGQFFDTMVVVHNYGKATLKLKKVEASCSCSSGTLQQGSIEPGQTGKIYVSINKHGLYGDARRVEFDVYSNAEDSISSFGIIFFDKNQKGDK